MTTTVTRALSGAVYVLLLVGATLYSPYSFLLLFGVLLLFSVGEFCKLVGLKPVFPLLLATLGYILFNLDNTVKTNEILLLIAALLVSIRSLVFLFEKKNRFLDKQSKYVFLIGYLIIPIIIFTKIPFISNSYHPEIIIAILILIWTNDTFAYLVGITIGKTKLFERISPNKTWEGAIGGAFLTVFVGFLCWYFFKEYPVLLYIGFAIIIAVVGSLGDLVQSMLKRSLNVKDSGKLMPGHGGVLDRFDGLILASPFIYAWFIFVENILI